MARSLGELRLLIFDGSGAMTSIDLWGSRKTVRRSGLRLAPSFPCRGFRTSSELEANGRRQLKDDDLALVVENLSHISLHALKVCPKSRYRGACLMLRRTDSAEPRRSDVEKQPNSIVAVKPTDWVPIR